MNAPGPVNSASSTPPNNRGGGRPSPGATPTNSDRNNNATPPGAVRNSLPPPPLVPNNARRPSQPRSPPVGARPKDLPPGAAPLGSIPHPPSSLVTQASSAVSVPLLASQLGRPVNLGERGGPHGGMGPLMGHMPPHASLSQHHLNLLSHTLSPFAAIPTGNGRIMARNINGTLAVTSHPSNESELQIYRVLQRANLLSYYDTFIAQGGDDVQQLCEAGEAEFLEIMDLVGMASKPMHVRRLQKALQEWVQNPGLFQTPLVPLSNFSAPSAAAAVIRASTSNVTAPPPPIGSRPANDPLSLISSGSLSGTPLMSASAARSRGSVSPPSGPLGALEKSNHSSGPHSPSPVGGHHLAKENSNSQPGGVPSPTYSQSGQDYPPLSSSPLQLTPSLVESQIQRIADTAENLIKAMSQTVETKQLKNNKKISKEVELVLSMPNDDPRKLEEIRRFSAIYGRFDCKRKPEKPLTLHEVSVNEAAAQLCLRKPILLMRRDELFPLARQVVRDSGYQYSKGHSRSQFQAGYPSKIFGLGSSTKSGDDENSRDSSNGGGSQSEPAKKRSRYSDHEDSIKKERFERITDELRHLGDRVEELKMAANQAQNANDLAALHAIGTQLEMIQARQNRLLQEQHAAMRPRIRGRMSTSSDPERPDSEDEEESQLSYSNTSSPNPHQSHVSSHGGSYVLSASGGQIIAVQNPALSLSMRSSSSPTSSSAIRDSNSSNLVNLLNLSRGHGMASAVAGNGKEHNAKKMAATSSTQLIHSDDEEMTFKQEPASPPTASRASPSTTNGKN